MPVFKSGRPSDRQTANAAQQAHLSLLAEGLRVVGEVESEGVITIEGRLEGNLRSKTQVLVAPGGVVVGDIAADEVVVVGRVEGNITAAKRIELRDGAVVEGDLTTPRVVVQEGGMVNGRLCADQPVVEVSYPSEPLRKTA
ncbi:MAG: polymer-forming cytoskeletal protein [Gemmatimonadota bacterium]|nr:polymer-forming cytoskeletal protein [Gemmatimonadota bacterium]MDH4350036.1 polymer-forming cytoskeletal protein [Gemmatimonadota bacterium]MDH5196941.1 polymer-forming cytoskeletal protein [Gemmatimonadota bacterium]